MKRMIWLNNTVLIGVQIVVLSRELHTSMSALASSELGCSLRGRNYWRIGCIKMVAPMGSLLTGSSSTFCFVALNLWHLLALCPARCIGLRSAKTLLDGGNSWKAKSPRKLLQFRTQIVPHHLAAWMGLTLDETLHFSSPSSLTLSMDLSQHHPAW
jgi:hypothetical protein